jgi:hypothetical protein
MGPPRPAGVSIPHPSPFGITGRVLAYASKGVNIPTKETGTNNAVKRKGKERIMYNKVLNAD